MHAVSTPTTRPMREALEFTSLNGLKLAPLTLLDVDDVNMDDLINKFNVAVTETANETLGKYRHQKQPWLHPTSSIYATSAGS